MKYQWILFDADETLFHFDAFKGLQLMFSRYDIDFTRHDYEEYQVTNKPLWVDYQDGTITAKQLQNIRFEGWAEKLNVSTQVLNSAFLEAMADICSPLPGAKELLASLHGKVKMGIITNGFTELQEIRLKRTGFTEYFDSLIISEQVGLAKPHPGIFEHALASIGQPQKDQVLMVGDNPHSDILGGLNAGLDTCWLNVNGLENPADIRPHYQVSSLHELQALLEQQSV
ncbi:pyrimidine 5'-nucleotidase [Psychromonas ossibalaenae]|uniref:pyrimidine 5'-nucleotidase n=1 Tax=Psychromonas ossibalaenae TaxID=444922 RepID=UPI0003672B29|nr:pyrimidine 5'-nucleotidase [Psychromonas ossibalaenae]